MAVVAIETVVENMLKQAGALPAHDRVSRDRLEITVRSAGGKNLHLPLSFGIIRVAMRENLRGHVIDPLWRRLRLQKKERWRGDRFCGAQQDLFRCLVEL